MVLESHIGTFPASKIVLMAKWRNPDERKGGRALFSIIKELLPIKGDLYLDGVSSESRNATRARSA
jgi:hypothetical protein